MAKIDIDLCFKVVMEAVDKAAKVVVEGHESALKVMTKTGPYDIVTEYDKRTEQLLIKTISDAFPDHKFVGEETAANNKITECPTWIIDPIDGTTNYVHGYPYIGICLAFAVKKEILIGVVCNPLIKQTFTAIKGRGAFLNGKQIHASKTTDLQKSLIGLEISIAARPDLTEPYSIKFKNAVTKVQGLRCIGSAELGLCMVAMGVWDGFHVDHLWSWDFAAGSIIITEAGGCVLGVDGEVFDCEKGGAIVAGTEELARKLVKVFKV